MTLMFYITTQKIRKANTVNLAEQTCGNSLGDFCLFLTVATDLFIFRFSNIRKRKI